MKLRLSSWLLIGFGALIVVALILSSLHPIDLVPMDRVAAEQNPMHVVMPTEKDALPVLSDFMPDFLGITQWLNIPDGAPLTKEDLKGKVILVDFWTYSCINCIRTQPVLRAWWKAYKDDGLVIVGVHTPEFAFEKVPKNVADAVKKAGLEYPIALDSDYQTWNAYSNHYWPAGYFFDRQGRLRFFHAGEGEYDKQEEVIRSLLAEDSAALTIAPTGADTSPTLLPAQTPETYLGLKRMAHFMNEDELKAAQVSIYTLRDPEDDAWSIGGSWNLTDEYALATEAYDHFSMNVKANAMHLVLGSADGLKKLRVLIDGQDPTDAQLTPDMKRQKDGSALIVVEAKDLYRIAKFPDAGRHLLELETLDPGIEFYAATFGE